MEIAPKIFTAKVMHKRLFPKVNSFTYGVYYLALPLDSLHNPPTTSHLAINMSGFLSFHEKDHRNHQGSCKAWAQDILSQHGLNDVTKHITLISMPRIMGYVFNPVSFWLCQDENMAIRAVLCEVNNTFGESHSYLCSHENNAIIHADEWLEAEKLFHVSPFLKREGHYKFRFSLNDNALGIWIDFYDSSQKKQLVTSLLGTLEPLTGARLRVAFWKHPMVTLKTIFLIHWQALKIILKGINYIPKPKQIVQRLSQTRNINKM